MALKLFNNVAQWSLQATLQIENDRDALLTVSWGQEEELLIGGSYLSLYTTHAEPALIWQKRVANTAKFAHLSYDSGYIASTGYCDRLAKVWRRLSYGSDDVRFDVTYLPHTKAVTELRWRRPYHLDQTIDNVLYTISADNVLRIWAATDPHGLQILQLWAQIDLEETIQPRLPSLTATTELRYAFIIDGRDFSKAAEHSVQHFSGEKRDEHALEHLVEVANRSPEVCVVLDGFGHMSAWGIENIGCKARKSTNIFNIAHVSGLSFHSAAEVYGEYQRFYSYCHQSSGSFAILTHHFDGKICFYESNISYLFDPSPRKERIKHIATWTGHSGSIKKIVRNISGSAVVSRTENSESVVWGHSTARDDNSLIRQSVIKIEEHIHRICVIRNGNFVVYLHHSSITLWDCRRAIAKLIASQPYELAGKPLCILVLPEIEGQKEIAHIATISSQKKGIVWQLQLSEIETSNGDSHSTSTHAIEQFATFGLGEAEDLAYVLPVDPAGSSPVVSGFLDTFARDVALSYTHSGTLRSWTAKVDVVKKKVDWLETCSVETGIDEPALASGSSIRKAAVVNTDRTELTIWDIRGAQLEHSQSFANQDTIQDLDWTSTPDDQSILAVGFRHRVQLLAQMRFDYLNKGPAWATIREISIREMTPHPIGDSTWLSGGRLIIGAGNQLFLYDKIIETTPKSISKLGLPQHKDQKWDLFDLVTRLNGPLPLFHPQFLGQCILAGKIILVQKVILALHKILKYHVEGEHIDNLLGLPLEDFYMNPEASTHAYFVGIWQLIRQRSSPLLLRGKS